MRHDGSSCGGSVECHYCARADEHADAMHELQGLKPGDSVSVFEHDCPDQNSAGGFRSGSFDRFERGRVLVLMDDCGEVESWTPFDVEVPS